MKLYNIFLIVLIGFIGFSCGKSSEDMASVDSKSSSGKSGSTARITIVGDYLYAVDNTTLKSVDISNPADPNLVNEVEIGFGIETIYPFKGNLFLGSVFGMYIYDISNPSSPTQVSEFWHATACDPVIANDTLAFVTLRNNEVCGRPVDTKEIQIINIEDMEYPYLQKTYFTDNYPYGLDMIEDYVFVCHGDAGVTAYDIYKLSDPAYYNKADVATIGGITAYDAIFYNNKLFVIGESGFYQYDYSDINNIQLISSILTN